ncbi:MAG TPA: glycosyltransferase family 39 protein [Geobacteraceae bacterium]|nr:glycosyltransferase family 39 protein [Geobacteraceae bacterium]
MTNRKFLLFLAAYGCLLLLPAYWLPLTESTEGRYAEIAREMLVSGNYLEPALNGIYHFHKPPFAYWAMAVGMKLFGVNGFGVRFFGIVAALLTVLVVQKTSRLVLQDEEESRGAGVLLASSMLFIALSRGVSTDIYLACSVSGALYFLFRQIYGTRSSLNAYAYALCLGAGFLIKGPVIFLFTLLPHLLAKRFDPRQRKVFTPREILTATLLFMAVALPWYLAVIDLHPQLFFYFTKTQTVDRVATEKFGRDKPFWYFFVLFPVTFFPWILTFVKGALRYKELEGKLRALYLYLLVPLVVFSCAKSKLPTYILPFYGTAAIIAVETWRRFGSSRVNRGILVGLLLFPIALPVAGFIIPALKPLRLSLAIAGIILFAAWYWLSRLAGDERFRNAVAGYLIGMSVIVFLVGAQPGVLGSGYMHLADSLNRLDSQRTVKTVIFRDFLPSLSFYRGELVHVAGKSRDTRFQADDSFRRWYLETDDDLRRAIAGDSRLFMVSRPAHLKDFEELTGFACSELERSGRIAAYDCLPAKP